MQTKDVAMHRMWMAAAVPCVSMLAMIVGFWAIPSWANKVSALTCVLVFGGALVTGLCVLGYVFIGWTRGAFRFTRGDILAATVFASLDVLIPATIILLIWLLRRSLAKSGGFIF